MCRWLLLLIFAVPGVACAQTTVFAAASLANALEAIGKRYTARSGQVVRFSFAASSMLARQIDAGAPADLFVSADERWMDWLEARKLIVRESRRDLLGNALVIVVPVARELQLDLTKGLDPAVLLGPSGRLVTGDPAHVPVGRYAEEALRRLDVWAKVESRLARADNVRAALALVERGAAAAGIVYATDAAASTKVRVAARIPAELHTPIVYPIALVARRESAEARRVLEFLQSEEARVVYASAGFATCFAMSAASCSLRNGLVR